MASGGPARQGAAGRRAVKHGSCCCFVVLGDARIAVDGGWRARQRGCASVGRPWWRFSAAAGGALAFSGPAGRGPAVRNNGQEEELRAAVRVGKKVVSRRAWVAPHSWGPKARGQQQKAGGHGAVVTACLLPQRRCSVPHQEVKGVAAIKLEAPVAGAARSLGALGVQRAARRRGGAGRGRRLQRGLGRRCSDLRAGVGHGSSMLGGWQQPEAPTRRHGAVALKLWLTAQGPFRAVRVVVKAPAAVGRARPAGRRAPALVSPERPLCG